MKVKITLLLGFILFCLAGCSKNKTEAQLVSVPKLIGFWQFENYGESNELTYNAVPSDEGLSAMEKSKMLEFREDGFCRRFFWNWCGTPPAIPSDWQDGVWELISENPQWIQITWDNAPDHPQTLEILELDEHLLFFRWQN